MFKNNMRKALLLFLILLTVTTAAGAKEEGALQTSDSLVAFIKDMEGFSEYPYWDHSQWTIGYGTSCKEGEYPNGITREEAEKKLMLEIESIELRLDGFLLKNDIVLNQNQYDALVSFTFNVGFNWTTGCKLQSYLVSGLENYTTNEIASAFGIWCHAGDELDIDKNLVARRIREVRIFLYGDYIGDVSANFIYLIFDGNGGSVDMDILLYEAGQPYGAFTTAQWEENTFQGWRTQPTGGTLLQENALAINNLTVYASWEAIEPISFSDVTEHDWFYTQVQELAQAGVISGYTDGTFRPQNQITVAEALKLILRACGIPEQAPTGAHWASGYLEYAVKQGLISAEQGLELDAPITRQLVSQLAANTLAVEQKSSDSPFTDTEDPSILALYQAGIINGYADGTFRPEGLLVRSEVSAIVWRMQRFQAQQSGL